MVWIVAGGTPPRPFFRWDWVWSHLDEIGSRTLEHIILTGIALGIGLLLATGLALLALRYRWTYAPIAAVTGAFYAIPSLALFAFLVPITGFTILTAQIGLVSYILLILVRTIVTGINGVDPAITEAATGMGYGRRRLFIDVQLPLAMPVIIVGIRVAAVTTVGLVTITALIGWGGLGFFILRGLNRFFETEIVLGTALSVVLAAIIDGALVGVGRVLTPWATKKAVVVP